MYDDWIDLFASFEENGVKALVIGGYAVGFYGFERYTKDLDIWVRPTAVNARAVYKSLVAFGVAPRGLSASDFAKPDCVVMIGREPYRVDFLTGPAGGDFAGAWKRRVPHLRRGVVVNYVGLDDLIDLKRAAGRATDLRDLGALMTARQIRDDPENAPRLPREIGETQRVSVGRIAQTKAKAKPKAKAKQKASAKTREKRELAKRKAKPRSSKRTAPPGHPKKN